MADGTPETPRGGPPPHLHRPPNHDMGDDSNGIFFAAVSTTRMPMIVTDPNQADNPIVFANPAFINMTGYSWDELVGQNCRLLQGSDTDRETVRGCCQSNVARRACAEFLPLLAAPRQTNDIDPSERPSESAAPTARQA